AHNLPLEARKQIRARIRLASTRLPTANASDTWHDKLPGPAIDQDDVDCAACHREHQGAKANLLAVSDAQCQTCHADRFGSFATTHPNWGQWPYGRGGDIAFDHRSHLTKHFPATLNEGAAVKFDCTRCHQQNDHGEITRTVSYEAGCQSCHDDALRIESEKGIELFALPTLPTEFLTQTRWPEMATGIIEGEISPLASLLMRSDESVAESLRTIGMNNLARLNTADPNIKRSIQLTANAHRGLLRDLADEGQKAVLDRLQELGISADVIEPIVRNLPAQILIDAYYDWMADPQNAQAMLHQQSAVRQVDFTDDGTPANAQDTQDSESILLPLRSPEQFWLPETRIAKLPKDELLTNGDDLLLDDANANDSGDDLLLDESLDETSSDADLLADDDLGSGSMAGDLLADDPLADDPLTHDPHTSDPLAVDPLESAPSRSETRPRFDPSSMMPAGGWYRDDVRMAIAYRGNGHSDPVLRATIELARRLPPSDPVRKQLLATRSIASCISCHQSAVQVGGSWHGRALVGSKTEFTKFTHGPHLKVSQLSDCQHCHQVNRDAATPADRSSTVQLASFGERQEEPRDPIEQHEFLPLGKHSCAACHTAKAAGESCTKCHRYHIQQ
ncbi:MAG: cytochrome c3 family protein, partial [Pirellulaceae bacterium]